MKREHQKGLGLTDILYRCTSWADNYVTYAYAWVTQTVSATSFGSSDIATPEQFITFMLRALGYSDARGDFVWSESFKRQRS